MALYYKKKQITKNKLGLGKELMKIINYYKIKL